MGAKGETIGKKMGFFKYTTWTVRDRRWSQEIPWG